MRSAIETLRKVEDTKKRNTLLRIIDHDIQRLDRLITDISRASRLDAELSKEEFQPLDIKPLFDNLQQRHQLNDNTSDKTTIGAVKNVEMIFRTERCEGVKVLGNENRLTQVFDNLIGNAVSFSPKGGKIIITAIPAKTMLRIRVDDEGPGIPEGKLETVFDRFYTQRPEQEDYGNHSGLGLSIAKQIVEAHRGELSAQNRYTAENKIKGARFTVDLPRIEDKL